MRQGISPCRILPSTTHTPGPGSPVMLSGQGSRVWGLWFGSWSPRWLSRWSRRGGAPVRVQPWRDRSSFDPLARQSVIM